MLMISFTVNAEKIYERTDSQGVAEFSDRPSPDSEVIEVKPNVVEVVQPEPGEPRPDSTNPASREQGTVRVVGEGAEHEGSSNYYDDDDRIRDREHRETHQPRQQHKGAARGAGGHR
jgi:hypothetical protein